MIECPILAVTIIFDLYVDNFAKLINLINCQIKKVSNKVTLF